MMAETVRAMNESPWFWLAILGFAILASVPITRVVVDGAVILVRGYRPVAPWLIPRRVRDEVEEEG